jgi:formamidopyrimidine-DNA glycosylase
MPELPEVQTVVNDLQAAGLVGTTITGAQVFWPRTVAALTPEAFCRRISGQTINTLWRRAKFIAVDFIEPLHLFIHLRMSGRLHLTSPDEPRQKHEHLVLDFDDGRQLRFHDTRKFGRMYLVNDPDDVIGGLGPEPLDPAFTPKVFAARLHARQRRVKPLLLDQTFLAGLGNIYVDEALWEARIHPQRLASSLSAAEVRALHQAIRNVLQRGLNNLGTTLGTGKANFYSVARREGRNKEELQVFRRTHQPCPRCQTMIERILVGQRSTHICPNCQPL